MVRTYIRKTDRQNWSSESMLQAVLAVFNREMGYKKAAQQFNVPQTTLERYVAKKREEGEHFKIDKTVGKFGKVFTEQQELELVQYLTDMEARLFGLTMTDFRKLAYQLAVRNNCNNRFNCNTEIAGETWMREFLKRNPTLALRKPEATSGARAMGFNKIAVDNFFGLLIETIDTHKLTGDRIYNSDETGVSVNPKGQSRILAKRGKRQVGIINPSERGQTVTAEICVSAAGNYMPPSLIFPRIRKQHTFELGLLPGSSVYNNGSGWMTTEIFLEWFKCFVKFSGATRNNKVLLLLDGHTTHTKNVELIDYARENGVILLCFPPHCSHRLQPLDVAFMKPLSSYYEVEIRKWMRCNPGKVVTLHQISTLFGAAFLNAATLKTAVNGFRKTGIWPPDPTVFSEADFLPAATTDIESDEVVFPTMSQKVPEESELDKEADIRQINEITPTKIVSTESEEPQPGCSWMPDNTERGSTADSTIFLPASSEAVKSQLANSREPDNIKRAPPVWTSSFSCVPPEAILHIPKVQKNTKRVTRKRGKTAVLTSTPYKNELEESLSKKAKKVKRNLTEEDKPKKTIVKETKTKGIKNNDTKEKKPKENKSKATSNISDSESSLEDEDAACLYCQEFYSKSTEGWVACSLCHLWAHNSCAGIDSEDDETVCM